jgi:hypothetical protein
MLGVRTRNSINPALALTAEGLEFKVVGRESWPYAALTSVKAGKGLLGATLGFEAARGALTVTVRDLATARQVLAALPRTVPLSPKAAALRGTLDRLQQ